MKAPETTPTSRATSPAAKDLFRTVLITPSDAAESAAWIFLDAVQQLFPKQIEELDRLGRVYVEEAEANALASGTDDDDPFLNYGLEYGCVYDGLSDRVQEWTETNGIACAAVDYVATRVAAGLGPLRPPSFVRIRSLRRNASGSRAAITELGPIEARPCQETLEEFLDRAKKYYHEAKEVYREAGFQRDPAKREREHFRWLAAHVVGNYSWSQIARGETPFRLRCQSEKTIAGEARKIADLIGIRLPKTRGPRPGSRFRRNVHRVPRARK